MKREQREVFEFVGGSIHVSLLGSLPRVGCYVISIFLDNGTMEHWVSDSAEMAEILESFLGWD